jgi:hypothetical protein
MEQVKQTAVEWLYEQLTSTWFDKTSGQHILEQAKELEKQQIIDAWENGYEHGACVYDGESIYHGSNYYNKTYGGNK